MTAPKIHAENHAVSPARVLPFGVGHRHSRLSGSVRMKGPGRQTDALERARVSLSTAKSAALFLLPLPLAFALVGALIAGDAGRAALSAGALASLWAAAVLVLRALIAEGQHYLGQRLDPPAAPLKLLSAILTTAGISLAAFASGQALAVTLVLAVLGAVGHLLFYGRDLRPARINVAIAAGVDRDAVTRQLKQAHGRLRGIESAARSIPLPEFRDRLGRITGIGRSILHEIERDPADAARARRFLNLYLDGAERVTVEYARTRRQERLQPLDQNFRELLTEMENTFTEQHRRLVDRDQMTLDVDIEVLNARLKGDGLG
jgi:5-bromo-4-chloroindolyl phosphate hydrolysis protein